MDPLEVLVEELQVVEYRLGTLVVERHHLQELSLSTISTCVSLLLTVLLQNKSLEILLLLFCPHKERGHK